MSKNQDNENASMTWKDRIERAKIKGSFTHEDKFLAGSYATDPLNEKYNLHRNTRFHDIRMWFKANGIIRIALDFMRAVNHDNPILAERLYGRIQEMPDLPEHLTGTNTESIKQQNLRDVK